ncbi:MAG: thymidine phosphorylase, partial [Myxococcales bacterium]|nr:thymidine phosphorylase [Myxococcales bacterium]
MKATFVELIAQKRDGKTLAADDIKRLIAGLGDGSLADYQMTALLMA